MFSAGTLAFVAVSRRRHARWGGGHLRGQRAPVLPLLLPDICFFFLPNVAGGQSTGDKETLDSTSTLENVGKLFPVSLF